MKGIVGYLVGALALALIGGAVLLLGLLDRDMARAEREINTLNYAAAQAAFQTAERYLEYASHIPGVGKGPLNDVRARAASLHYWQQDFGSIVPKQNDPVTAVAADNVGLQFVTANAVYRAGQTRAKDRQTTMQAIDAASAGTPPSSRTPRATRTPPTTSSTSCGCETMSNGADASPDSLSWPSGPSGRWAFPRRRSRTPRP
jgi:hypothetical protein